MYLRLYILANMIGIFTYSVNHGVNWHLAVMILAVVIGVIVMFDNK